MTTDDMENFTMERVYKYCGDCTYCHIVPNPNAKIEKRFCTVNPPIILDDVSGSPRLEFVYPMLPNLAYACSKYEEYQEEKIPN